MVFPGVRFSSFLPPKVRGRASFQYSYPSLEDPSATTYFKPNQFFTNAATHQHLALGREQWRCLCRMMCEVQGSWHGAQPGLRAVAHNRAPPGDTLLQTSAGNYNEKGKPADVLSCGQHNSGPYRLASLPYTRVSSNLLNKTHLLHPRKLPHYMALLRSIH